MRKSLAFIVIAFGLTGCTVKHYPTGEDYWQRMETDSALYLTGPKAQQQLEQDISVCVREISELIRLEAVRETTPPDTRSDYLRALDAAEDTAHWDTPSHIEDVRVDHSDFQDFEGCMRFKGWERVEYVRYPAQQAAQRKYNELYAVRKYGPGGQKAYEAFIASQLDDYEELNE